MLLFLLEHAPLERWQRDVLAIVRDEAYYFAPQAQTKIMNEGWATYWHSHDHDRARRSTRREIIDYADHHSGTLATPPGRLNPYKLGIELFRDIEDRWNKGQFGKEWDECDDMRAQAQLGPPPGPRPREDLRGPHALQRHHLHRRVPDRSSSAVEQKLFSFGFNERSGNCEIVSREFKKVKEKLLFSS